MRNRAREVDDVSATFRLVRRDGSPVWVEAKLRIVRDGNGALIETHAIAARRPRAHRGPARAGRGRGALPHGLRGGRRRHGDRLDRGPHAARQPRAVHGHRPPAHRARGPHDALAAAPGRPRAAHPGDPSGCWPAASRRRAASGATCTTTAASCGSPSRPRWSATRAGSPLHFLTQVQDVTERRRYEAELRHMADHDALTGLLNRRAFERELERHVDHVARYGPRGAAVLLDVDLFKNVNDTLGHSAGDQLICKVADALREQVRDGAVIARLGGDEFAVLIPDGTPDGGRGGRQRAAGRDPHGPHLQPLRPPAHGQRQHRRRPVRLRPADRRGRARRRRPRDVRGQGGRPRPGRLPRRRARRTARASPPACPGPT